jgi:hypothetical protein
MNLSADVLNQLPDNAVDSVLTQFLFQLPPYVVVLSTLSSSVRCPPLHVVLCTLSSVLDYTPLTPPPPPQITDSRQLPVVEDPRSYSLGKGDLSLQLTP